MSTATWERKLPKFVQTEANETRVSTKCATCGKVEAFSTHSAAGGLLPSTAINRFFLARGWTGLDKRPVCKACRANERHEKAQKRQAAAEEKERQKMATPPPKPVIVPTVQAPEMSAADRRRVWREIDDSYSSDGSGYCAGITDHTLAMKLGVPRAWVEQIREENFGPAINEDFGKLEAEIKAAVAAAKAASERALTAASAAEDAAKAGNALAERLERLKAAVGPRGKVA